MLEKDINIVSELEDGGCQHDSVLLSRAKSPIAGTAPSCGEQPSAISSIEFGIPAHGRTTKFSKSKRKPEFVPLTECGHETTKKIRYSERDSGQESKCHGESDLGFPLGQSMLEIVTAWTQKMDQKFAAEDKGQKDSAARIPSAREPDLVEDSSANRLESRKDEKISHRQSKEHTVVTEHSDAPREDTLGVAKVVAAAKLKAKTGGYGGKLGGHRKKKLPAHLLPGQKLSGRWTNEEHEAFLRAFKEFGQKWYKVALRVPTRTVIQVRTHGQKHLMRLLKEGKPIPPKDRVRAPYTKKQPTTEKNTQLNHNKKRQKRARKVGTEQCHDPFKNGSRSNVPKVAHLLESKPQQELSQPLRGNGPYTAILAASKSAKTSPPSQVGPPPIINNVEYTDQKGGDSHSKPTIKQHEPKANANPSEAEEKAQALNRGSPASPNSLAIPAIKPSSTTRCNAGTVGQLILKSQASQIEGKRTVLPSTTELKEGEGPRPNKERGNGQTGSNVKKGTEHSTTVLGKQQIPSSQTPHEHDVLSGRGGRMTPHAGNRSNIMTPHHHDVLSGRGNFVNHHRGNEFYRNLVQKYKVAYIASPKLRKGRFAELIVNEVLARNPPGRFLKQDPRTKLWNDVGRKKAIDKTRQALREGAPQLTKKLQLMPANSFAPSSSATGQHWQQPTYLHFPFVTVSTTLQGTIQQCQQPFQSDTK